MTVKPTTHDDYIAAQPAAMQALLQGFRARLAAMLPQADQVISYAMPAFKLNGKAIAGYAGWVKHASFYPHSGGVVPKFQDELSALGFSGTKSAVHFTEDRQIPDDLLRKLINARLAEAGLPQI